MTKGAMFVQLKRNKNNDFYPFLKLLLTQLDGDNYDNYVKTSYYVKSKINKEIKAIYNEAIYSDFYIELYLKNKFNFNFDFSEQKVNWLGWLKSFYDTTVQKTKLVNFKLKNSFIESNDIYLE